MRQIWRWILWFLRWLIRLPPEPVTGLRAIRITELIRLINGSNDMERYRIGWLPSPSTFVDKHELHGSINGGPLAILAGNLYASAVSVDIDLALGNNMEICIRTHGDNLTFADSARLSFVVQNGETVQPVTGLVATWLQHIP